MKKRLGTERGVTLVELMIVGVIIGLVAAMAVPRFQTAYEQMQIKSANRGLTSSIRLARSYSISEKTPYGIYFDGASVTFTLFKDVVNIGSGTFETGDSVLREVILPPEFDILSTDCTGDVVVFRPNGSAVFSGGGNIYTMAFLSESSSYSSNSILASTGRVSTSTATL